MKIWHIIVEWHGVSTGTGYKQNWSSQTNLQFETNVMDQQLSALVLRCLNIHFCGFKSRILTWGRKGMTDQNNYVSHNIQSLKYSKATAERNVKI